MAHGVVDHRHHRQVGVGHEIGDVARRKDLAGAETHDLVGGDAAICASYVSIPPRLALETNGDLREVGGNYRYSGLWPEPSLTKNSGSSVFIASTHLRLLSKMR